MMQKLDVCAVDAPLDEIIHHIPMLRIFRGFIS